MQQHLSVRVMSRIFESLSPPGKAKNEPCHSPYQLTPRSGPTERVGDTLDEEPFLEPVADNASCSISPDRKKLSQKFGQLEEDWYAQYKRSLHRMSTAEIKEQSPIGSSPPRRKELLKRRSSGEITKKLTIQLTTDSGKTYKSIGINQADPFCLSLQAYFTGGPEDAAIMVLETGAVFPLHSTPQDISLLNNSKVGIFRKGVVFHPDETERTPSKKVKSAPTESVARSFRKLDQGNPNKSFTIFLSTSPDKPFKSVQVRHKDPFTMCLQAHFSCLERSSLVHSETKKVIGLHNTPEEAGIVENDRLLLIPKGKNFAEASAAKVRETRSSPRITLHQGSELKKISLLVSEDGQKTFRVFNVNRTEPISMSLQGQFVGNPEKYNLLDVETGNLIPISSTPIEARLRDGCRVAIQRRKRIDQVAYLQIKVSRSEGGGDPDFIALYPSDTPKRILSILELPASKYILSRSDTGDKLDNSKSLAEQGIHDGCELNIVEKAP